MNITVEGAKVFWTIKLGLPILGDLEISETIVVAWLVMAIITGLCWWLTRDMKIDNISKRQAAAEALVELADNFVISNMGEKFRYFIPFVAALFSTSLISNLIALIPNPVTLFTDFDSSTTILESLPNANAFRSPTADLSTEAAWAIIVFILITRQKIKTDGFGGYLKGFTTPIAVMTPFNILSELATPISMACRHFGNILSGIVINGLIYAALALASGALLGLLPGILGEVLAKIPVLSVGLPAILSFYFDWFTGVMQAFIFSMLTVQYIKNAAGD